VSGTVKIITCYLLISYWKHEQNQKAIRKL
jgi:hypothetical protein